jgi:polar amino acid transport system ATP-binding protein/sulfate transport system ATP-binding protein
MGVVQQHYPLFAHRTILGNLLLVSKDKEKVYELIKRFKLEDLVSSYPCQLSGGQKQRVAIIQQILCSDRYILMDEPFSGLDLVNKCEVCKLIREVVSYHEENTVIIVTHDIPDALRVSDTIWMLGRDRDETGGVIPGAYIKHKINLIERGLSMACCPVKDPMFYDMVREINEKFIQL